MTTVVIPEPFPGERPVTEAVVKEHKLNATEYAAIRELLGGRVPTLTELGIFSALWSEHCSYKHTKPVLRRFPTEGKQVLQGPGENAGVLRLPDGWAVAFKIESHNHPSAVEPYQGAATGVGGILRDVFTMGARPVALLNSLRLGPLDEARNRWLFGGIVKGVGDYGNCIGVPTLGGEVVFSPGYSGNPLVNAMAVGILRADDLITAKAHGVGNILLTVGARTGRDGIHGASFASEDLSAESEKRRPQVQVGDPFTEKLLLEASLELITGDYIVAIQDMGAAGLTSSSAEMAARGGVGVELDTSAVPTREPGMTPYEIMLSESQERMLVVAEPHRVEEIQVLCRKWDLEAVAVGLVTDDGLFRIIHDGRTVASIPGQELVEGCPIYTPAAQESAEAMARRTLSPTVPLPDLVTGLERLLDAPTIASKRWVFEQFDGTVRAGSRITPGGDAGVLRVEDTGFGLAMTVDCNARHVLLDPYEGGKGAVAEAARNIACTGARPLGITDCLNFGNPERPEVFFQFTEACRGISDACLAFDTPVTGGNVSLYNQSPTGAIDPSPVIGMVGILDDVTTAVPSHFAVEGDAILLLGRTAGHLGGSAWWAEVLECIGGPPPKIDLAAERALQEVLIAAASGRLLRSAHDCSDGGLAVALAEACIGGPWATDSFGATIDLARHHDDLSDEQWLFGEDGARAVVSCDPANVAALQRLAGTHGVPAHYLGLVGPARGELIINRDERQWRWPVSRLRSIHADAIPRRMAAPTAVEG
ncbi:MAG: phosphoribosylformylglycinamidine synthase subunit PurL [Gemmatimonadales bacterium]|nr:phosphoribosylformylglycinamidine synthase subunit PurL [Gemmatimonadales bacterium]MDZ4389058.1 phosphoribosylformylglycinamidine synthase subunit PurL [Gemmatimonadales bacterium]